MTRCTTELCSSTQSKSVGIVQICVGPFTVENCDPKETDQPCTVSTLNVSLSEVANGTVIQCNTSTLANNIEIGTATIVKAGIHTLNYGSIIDVHARIGT